MNLINFDDAMQQIDVAQEYINELSLQVSSVQDGLNKLKEEIKEKLNNTVNRPRRTRNTLSSYKRYNLKISYELKDKYKALYGDLIKYDWTWYYIGQKSKMPAPLKNLIIDKNSNNSDNSNDSDST